MRIGPIGTAVISGGAIMIGGLWGGLAQTGAQNGGGSGSAMGEPWSGLLSGGGITMAGLIFYFYRQDRKSAEDSMIKMGSEFRQIVEANTRAITALEAVISRADNDD